jgi:hypothetical protein
VVSMSQPARGPRGIDGKASAAATDAPSVNPQHVLKRWSA